MLFEKFGDTSCAKMSPSLMQYMTGKWDRVIDYANREVFDKSRASTDTLKKLRHAAAVDRRVTLRLRFWSQSSASFVVVQIRG